MFKRRGQLFVFAASIMNCNRILNFTENDFPNIADERKQKNVTAATVIDPVDVSVADSQCISGTNCDAAVVNISARSPSQQEQSHCDKMKASVDKTTSLPGQGSKHRQRQYRKSSRIKTFRDFLIPKEFADMVRKERCEAIRSQRDVKSVAIVTGNPLDSDKPARCRGIANAPKKPKRMTAIKRHVYQHRNDNRSHLDCINFDAPISNDVDDDRIECEHDCSQFSKFDCRLENLMKNRTDLSKYLASDQTPHETSPSSIRQRENDDTAPTAEDTHLSPAAAQRTDSAPVPPYLSLIHHHNFKRFCDNCITGELNRAAEQLVVQMFRFQRRKYETNPIRAVSNKRYVIGLKQVRKYLVSNKIELLLLVPDMEDSLCETVEELKTLALAYSIPYFFAFSRQKLGYLMGKKNGVASFGLLNSMGAEENLKKTLEAARTAKKYYREKCEEARHYYAIHLRDRIEKIRSQETELNGGNVDDDVAAQFNKVLCLESKIDETEELERKIIDIR